METAVLVVWGIGLLGGLVALVVILKQISLVLGTVGAIRMLAGIIREAARGIDARSAKFSALAPLGSAAEGLREAAGRQAAAAESAARKLEAWSGE